MRTDIRNKRREMNTRHIKYRLDKIHHFLKIHKSQVLLVLLIGGFIAALFILIALSHPAAHDVIPPTSPHHPPPPVHHHHDFDDVVKIHHHHHHHNHGHHHHIEKLVRGDDWDIMEWASNCYHISLQQSYGVSVSSLPFKSCREDSILLYILPILNPNGLA